MARTAKIREPDPTPEAHDLRHVLDIGLQAKAATISHAPATSWYSSSLGYCMRRQFFDRLGVPKDQSYRSSRTLWLGDIIHHGVQQMLWRSGLMLAEELSLVDDELQIHGRLDALWGGEVRVGLFENEEDYSPDWKRFLVAYRETLKMFYGDRFPITGTEFKSANQYSAERSFTEGMQLHHKMQIGSYDLMVQRNPSLLDEVIDVDHVDRWQLVMLAKSDLKMPIFDSLPILAEKAHERLVDLNTFWDAQITPPCTCGQDISWERNYCPYQNDIGECCDLAYLENFRLEEAQHG